MKIGYVEAAAQGESNERENSWNCRKFNFRSADRLIACILCCSSAEFDSRSGISRSV